jgi:hypothetical protein
MRRLTPTASVARALAPAFLLHHPLLDTVDPAVQLVEPLPVLLRHARCGLRFGQRLLGGAVGRLELGLDRVDALRHWGHLFAHIGFGRTSAEDGGCRHNRNCGGYFGHRWEHCSSSIIISQVTEPKLTHSCNRAGGELGRSHDEMISSRSYHSSLT